MKLLNKFKNLQLTIGIDISIPVTYKGNQYFFHVLRIQPGWKYYSYTLLGWREVREYPRALFYAFEKKVITMGGQKKIRANTCKKLAHCYPVGVAVVVQKMIQSEISGICFTAHPVTQDLNQMVIETGWGLGEAIVGGKITPDTYIIDKKNWIIIDTNISDQEMMIVKSGSGIKETTVSEKIQSIQKLENKQIIKLAKLCQKIEEHYKHPQDIEFAIADNKIYITQSRPITTL